MTALAVAMVLAFRLVARTGRSRKWAPAIFLIQATTVLSVLAFVYFGSVTQMLGRDETLTGRTTIWAWVIRAWEIQPLTGYGWVATWDDRSYIQRFISSNVLGRVYHAHDSYLDVLVQLGWVGVAILCLCLVVALRKSSGLAAQHLRDRRGVYFMFPLTVLLLMGIYSVVETRISHYLGWLLITYACASGSWLRNARDSNEEAERLEAIR
jgi:exopolysaccharide production protein ExoQ